MTTWRKTVLALVLALAPATQALADGGDLDFFKQYFVTGDTVVGGVGLRGKGIGGYATASIVLSGVPANADVVAAFLYWQTSTASDAKVGAEGAQFAGHDLTTIAKVLNTSGAPVCALNGSGTTTASTRRIYTYRADVKRYLAVNPMTGKLDINTSHPIRIPDNGNGLDPATQGASLVVVFRDPAHPLRAVVIYDGVHTMNASSPSMTQTFPFFQAATTSPKGRLTNILSDGQSSLSERMYVDGKMVATNPFIGTAGTSWDSPTVWAAPAPGAASLTVSVRPASARFDCLSWAAAVYSTTVQDSDRDGLLDTWESSGLPLVAPDGEVLPNLKARTCRTSSSRSATSPRPRAT